MSLVRDKLLDAALRCDDDELDRFRKSQPGQFWGVVARVMPRPAEEDPAKFIDTEVSDPDELSRMLTAELQSIRKELRTLPVPGFVDSGNGRGGNGHA